MLAPPLGSWRPLLREILDPPLHLIAATLTPQMRKHGLMYFVLGDQIGHQIYQWVQLATKYNSGPINDN